VDFKEGLGRTCIVETMKKDLLMRTKGPQMRVNALRICRPIDTIDPVIKQQLENPDRTLPVE
jgi:hypothetical protein